MARKKPSRKQLERTLEEAREVKRQLVEKIAALSTAAFGLVAALAWNSAVQEIFSHIFGEQSTIGARIGYAMIVTAIAVVVTLWIGKIAGQQK